MICRTSSNLGVSPRRLVLLAMGTLALVLAACETAPGPVGPSVPGPAAPPAAERPVTGTPPEPLAAPVQIADRAYTPAHMRGEPITRIGLLLPFSASAPAARAEARRILQAAELALFERAGDALVLLPKDTGGTPDGARAAAEAAVEDGAQLILGPLFSASVAAAGPVARQADIAMIAFSTDSTVAGDSVFLLSFPPDEEVRRVTEFAAARGVARFAFVGPSSAYGQTAYEAFSRTIEGLPDRDLNGVSLVGAEFYEPGVGDMTAAASRLARLGVEGIDPALAATMTAAAWSPSPGSPFQAVMLPEGGDQVRMLAPAMLYERIDPLLVKFLGTGLWRDPALTREPALQHGWFAGPDPAARDRFESVYQSVYGETPSRLAGLGYDAASLAALFAAEREFGVDRLTDPDGFIGVDGLFRFRPDGTIERGLAVYSIRPDGFEVLDPAPRSFGVVTGELGGVPADVEPDQPS